MIDPRQQKRPAMLGNARRNIYDFLNNREEEAASRSVESTIFRKSKVESPSAPFPNFSLIGLERSHRRPLVADITYGGTIIV